MIDRVWTSYTGYAGEGCPDMNSTIYIEQRLGILQHRYTEQSHKTQRLVNILIALVTTHDS